MGLSLPIAAEVEYSGEAALSVTNSGTVTGSKGVYGLSRIGVRGDGTTAGVFGWGGDIGVWAGSDLETAVAVRASVFHPGAWAGRFRGGQGVYASGETNSSSDLVLGGSSAASDDGRIFSDTAYASSDIWLHSNDAVVVKLDSDDSGEDSDFEIRDASDAVIFDVDESGTVYADGVLVHSSDRNRKEGIVPVDAAEMLDKVLRLPVHHWRYRGQSTPHVGPMAQDFYSTFEVGGDDKHMATSDAAGVALAAIQGLYAVVQEQQILLDMQQTRIAKLEAELAGY
jgi:hypothetical protein